MKRMDDELKCGKLKKIGFCLVEIPISLKDETCYKSNFVWFNKKLAWHFQSNKLQVDEYVNSNKTVTQKGFRQSKIIW